MVGAWEEQEASRSLGTSRVSEEVRVPDLGPLYGGGPSTFYTGEGVGALGQLREVPSEGEGLGEAWPPAALELVSM